MLNLKIKGSVNEQECSLPSGAVHDPAGVNVGVPCALEANPSVFPVPLSADAIVDFKRVILLGFQGDPAVQVEMKKLKAKWPLEAQYYDYYRKVPELCAYRNVRSSVLSAAVRLRDFAHARLARIWTERRSLASSRVRKPFTSSLRARFRTRLL